MNYIAFAGLFGSLIISQFAWAQVDGTVESRGLIIPQQTAPPPPSRSNVTNTPSPGGSIPIPYPNVGKTPLPPDLAVISTMLVEDKPPAVVLEAWKHYVTRQVQSRQPIDVQATLQQVTGHAQAQLKTRADADRKRLADRLNTLGDDAQLANVELQNILQKQQQTLQMMSNISKMMHDTAMAVIRKIGG